MANVSADGAQGPTGSGYSTDNKGFQVPPEQKIYPAALQDAKNDSPELKAARQKMRAEWDAMKFNVIVTDLNMSTANPKAIAFTS
jgi:hypothetical protein